jgi:hypothetical protein
MLPPGKHTIVERFFYRYGQFVCEHTRTDLRARDLKRFTFKLKL